MGEIDKNHSHPCYGKSCENCETCMFDEYLFNYDKLKKQNMEENDSCHLCGSLIKNYIGDDRLRFNACCGRSIIGYTTFTRPRVIKANIGPMVPLPIPSWCPKKRGVVNEYVSPSVVEEEPTPKLPLLPIVAKEEPKKPMTYAEKKEKLMGFPRRIEWDDIEEDAIYVIPKIMSQSRKVVRIIVKSDTFLRCSEIDEYGEESKTLTSIYPKDIDAVFITKLLRY